MKTAAALWQDSPFRVPNRRAPVTWKMRRSLLRAFRFGIATQKGFSAGTVFAGSHPPGSLEKTYLAARTRFVIVF